MWTKKYSCFHRYCVRSACIISCYFNNHHFM
uniref:Uncharacterized protein n=1 Tax=Anguilla anguilla TaxID=7936 RepID=A0A0E9Y0M1_ANGAN